LFLETLPSLLLKQQTHPKRIPTWNFLKIPPCNRQLSQQHYNLEAFQTQGVGWQEAEGLDLGEDYLGTAEGVLDLEGEALDLDLAEGDLDQEEALDLEGEALDLVEVAVVESPNLLLKLIYRMNTYPRLDHKHLNRFPLKLVKNWILDSTISLMNPITHLNSHRGLNSSTTLLRITYRPHLVR